MSWTSGRRGARPWARRRQATTAAIALAFAGLVSALPAVAVADAAADPGGSVSPLGVSLTGSTIDALGRTIGGVEVRLHATDPDTGRLVLRSVESDKHGRFSIGDLSPGMYRVIAVKGGYAVLVGQVNTLYERTLELILRPAGEGAAAGSRPESGAWVLRLPRRDPLEDLAFTPDGDRATRATGGGLSIPLSLELVASHRDGGGEELSAAGLAAEIATTFEMGGAGFVGMSYRHQRDGDRLESSDRFDAVQARFAPGPDDEAFPVALRLDAERQRRDRSFATRDGAHVLAEGARLQASWTGNGSDGAVSAELDAAMLQAVQDVGDPLHDVLHGGDAYRARRAELEVSGQRVWRGDHRTTYTFTMRAVSGGLVETAGAPPLALVPIVAQVESAVLDALGTSTLDLRIDDRWIAESIGADMRTRFRIEHGAGRRDSIRGSAALGSRFGLPAALVLDVDGGVGVLSDGEAAPIWTAALSGGGDRFSWSVATRSEVGIAAWRSKRSAAEPAGVVLPVVTDRDGKMQGWSARAAWRHRDGWPEVRLRGQTFAITGQLAAYLPGDLPWAPIDERGSGSGATVDLVVDVPATGTFVSVAWTSVEDRSGEGVLLSGANEWSRQQLDVRQRLHESERRGATWELVLGVERGKVVSPESTREDSPRLAFLDQSRISGGLALAF